MAEKKKMYYWMQLKNDFFDDDTIRYLEEQENGIAYVNFYLKLCLKSLKTDGKLIRVVGDVLMPYDVKSLARFTNVPCDTVAVAMQEFERIGLIKILDTGEIWLSQIEELIGSETEKAKLMRISRAKKKVIGNNVTNLLPKCSQNVTQSIEIEKDKELEKEREKENTRTPEEGESSLSESESESSDQEPEVFLELGKYNHVLLTVKQIDSLKAELGEETYLACIAKLDSYCEKTGKTYNNYEIAIRDWVLGQVQEDQKQAKAKKCEAEKKKKTDYNLIYSKRENNSG